MISYYTAGFNIQAWLEVQSACLPLSLGFVKGKKSQEQYKQTVQAELIFKIT